MHTEFYNDCNDFFEMFEEGYFDEEVMHDGIWYGLVRDEDGTLQVHAEYVYEAIGTGDNCGVGSYK